MIYNINNATYPIISLFTDDELFLFVPCPLSSVTKMMADSVAKNFQLLYEYVYLDAR